MAYASEAKQLDQWLRVALNVARSAGRIALQYTEDQLRKGAALEVEIKPDQSPVTAADKAVNEHVKARLEACFPDVPVVGEEDREGSAPREILSNDIWFVDPIDGTKSFIEGTAEWCVLIGLVRQGAPVLGVVYQPVIDVAYFARLGGGAWRQAGSAPPARMACSPAEPGRPATVVRSKRNPPRGFSKRIEGFRSAQPGCVIDHSPGSFGLRLTSVARGDADFYIACGSTCLWDSAASEVIAREAGCAVLTLYPGDPEMRRIEYNTAVSLVHRRHIVCFPAVLLPAFKAHALPLLSSPQEMLKSRL